MNIIVFGDSITQGFDDTEKGGWVNRLFIDICTRSIGQESSTELPMVFNLGVDSDTSEGVRTRMIAELQPRLGKNNLIIFDIGGNDCIRNLETDKCLVSSECFRENYDYLIKTAKQYGAVVCLGLHDTDELQITQLPYYKGLTCLDTDGKRYDQAIEKLAIEHDVLYVPMRGLLSQNFTTLTYDGDHPSAAGHQLIYERVKGELEKAGIL